MGLYIAMALLLAACSVGGVGAIRAIRAMRHGPRPDLAKAANPLFYAAALLALAAAAVLAISGP